MNTGYALYNHQRRTEGAHSGSIVKNGGDFANNVHFAAVVEPRNFVFTLPLKFTCRITLYFTLDFQRFELLGQLLLLLGGQSL